MATALYIAPYVVQTVLYTAQCTVHRAHIFHISDGKMEAAITGCIFTCTYLCKFTTKDQGSAGGQAGLLALKALPLVRLGIIPDKTTNYTSLYKTTNHTSLYKSTNHTSLCKSTNHRGPEMGRWAANLGSPMLYCFSFGDLVDILLQTIMQLRPPLRFRNFYIFPIYSILLIKEKKSNFFWSQKT